MAVEIKITNDSSSVSIEKKSSNDNFLIRNEDGQSIWMSEQELRELKYMIDDILQHFNKRDW